MTTPEQQAQEEVSLAAASLNMRLLRNNRGAFKDDYGNYIWYGLGNKKKARGEIDDFKSSDLIGITTITITADMVGKQIGVFTAVEVKPKGFKIRNFKTGSHEKGQLNFLEWVVRMGGFAGFATSKNDLHHIWQHFDNWLKK